jgi:hypothetical protein
MGGIADENIKFTIEAAGIRDPNTLISHLKTLKSSAVSTEPDINQASTSRVSKRGLPPLKCFLCNQTGHLRRSCPNQGSRGGKLLAIEHKRIYFIGNDANAKFFKTVALNGHQIKSFVDFGSECSLITAKAAKNLRLLLVVKPRSNGLSLEVENYR